MATAASKGEWRLEAIVGHVDLEREGGGERKDVIYWYSITPFQANLGPMVKQKPGNLYMTIHTGLH